MGVLLVYSGLLAILFGASCILKPPRLLGIGRRRTGGLILAFGSVLMLAGPALPAPVKRSPGSRQIDRLMPEYHFNEVHSIRIQAPARRILQEIRAVTPGEIRWLHTLFWIRSLPARLTGRAVPRPPDTRPILGPKLDSGTVLLAEDPERELVFGKVGQFWKAVGGSAPRVGAPEDFLALDRPDYAQATLNFSVEELGEGWCRLTTETRVFTPDPRTRRKFAAYWRVIYPGSSLLRRTWLQAVKRRAEASRPAI